MTPATTASDNTADESATQRVLVTGATGYLGGRLVPALLEAGYSVRVLARTPAKLDGVPWADDVEIAKGDLGDKDSLAEAFDGVDVVYYLVHSMGSSGHDDFQQAERDSAENVAAVAAKAGVGRIVYLGGLHPQSGELSTHLESRAEVGRILIDSSVPTFVLQAGVVIGSGSASFEMIRHLTNRLPVMTTPKWVHNKIQPIAVQDILHYLVRAADADLPKSRTFDVGGPDVLEYGEMMNEYAEVAGLRKRRMVVLPVLTPRLAGHWIGLVTPMPRGLAMPLIESLEYDAVAHEHDIDDVIEPPAGGPTSYRDAVRSALRAFEAAEPETTWSASSVPADPLPTDPHWAGEVVYGTERRVHVGGDVGSVRRRLSGMAETDGPAGWHLDDRESDDRKFDDEYDVVLRSAAKLPGRAYLRMRVVSDGSGASVEQRLDFFPRGLAGHVFWYASWPVRTAVAGRALRRIAVG